MKRNLHLKFVNITNHVDQSECRPIITLGQTIRSVRENGVSFEGVETAVYDDTDAVGVDPLSNPRTDKWDVLENASNSEYRKQFAPKPATPIEDPKSAVTE